MVMTEAIIEAEGAIGHFAESIKNWIERQFEEGKLGGIKKADILKSAAAVALLAQLISLVQKDLPKESNIRDMLDPSVFENGQANITVRLERPWETALVDESGRELKTTIRDRYEITLIVGPWLSKNDPSDRGVIAFDFSSKNKKPVIEVWKSTDDSKREITRAASLEELRIISDLAYKVTKERLVEEA